LASLSLEVKGINAKSDEKSGPHYSNGGVIGNVSAAEMITQIQ